MASKWIARALFLVANAAFVLGLLAVTTALLLDVRNPVFDRVASGFLLLDLVIIAAFVVTSLLGESALALASPVLVIGPMFCVGFSVAFGGDKLRWVPIAALALHVGLLSAGRWCRRQPIRVRARSARSP